MTKTNKTMDNPDKLATKDTGRRLTKQWTIQINLQQKTHDEDKQNNGQSRQTGNTRHRRKTNKTIDNPDKQVGHKRHRSKTNKTMDNPDKLAT